MVRSAGRGVDDDVVLVGARRPVERPAAGDQAERRARGRGVDALRGERVLVDGLDGVHSEVGDGAVAARDVDGVARAKVAQVPEDAGAAVGVDVAHENRGAGVSGGGAIAVPADVVRRGRRLELADLVQPEGPDAAGVYPGGGD